MGGSGYTDGAAEPVVDPDARPALLDDHRLRTVRAQVETWSFAGRLEPDAVAAFDDGVRPLRWAAALVDDAAGVLDGDPVAAERLRLVLAGVGAAAAPVFGRALPAGNAPLPAAPALPPGDPPQRSLLPLVPGEPDRDPAPPATLRPGQQAVAALAAAAVWAADDIIEAQTMLDGLAAVLWSRSWVEAVLDVAEHGDPATLRTLMSGPGGGPTLPGGGLPGGPPGGGFPGGPGGGLPDLPKTPTWPLLPPKRPPIRFDPTIPGSLGLEVPSHQEQCIIGAIVAAKQAADAAPRWDVAAISDPAACPSEVVTLSGTGFGASGAVLFTAGDGTVTATEVVQWTDSQIRVRVPETASPGPIRLRVLERTLILCGRPWPVHRLGASRVRFGGGRPVILQYLVDGQGDAEIVVAPETEIQIDVRTSSGADVIVRVTVRQGATVLLSTTAFGGTQSFQVRTPATELPVELRVSVRAENGCGSASRSTTVVVARQPDLRILQAEVTQAVQRLDNSVRLAERRSTVLRVWLGSGLERFSYLPGESRALPGVTASLALVRGGVTVATVGPDTSPFTVRTFFMPEGRETTDRSLEFVLPREHLLGEVTLRIRVELGSPPRGVRPGGHTSDARDVTVRFEPVRALSLVRVLVRDDWRGLPAPSLAEWQTALQGARVRFPVPDDGWQVRVLPGLETISSDNDLSDWDGWDDVLEDLDDVAGDASDSWSHIWVGVLPAFRPGVDAFTIRGIARHPDEVVDRPWPLSNDYTAMAVLAGRPEVFAHELGHVLGARHAGCPDGQHSPEGVDPGLPQRIEEVGFDTSTMTPFARGVAGELMGYCDEGGLWPTIVTWTRAMDRLT